MVFSKSSPKRRWSFPADAWANPPFPLSGESSIGIARGGFDALARKDRQDRGRARSAPADIIATAIELKKEQPRRSHVVINRFLNDIHGAALSRSTLYRHLKDAGATRLKLGIVKAKVRKRWTRDHTHDLWVGDFEEGPYVLVGPEVLPTYLSAFIDCHSRFVVEARYYLRQTLDILIDSLLRGLAKHGAPSELYLDNAKVYHSNGLKATCYRLHTRLSPPAGEGSLPGRAHRAVLRDRARPVRSRGAGAGRNASR